MSLDPALQTWIAENLLIGCEPPALVATLIGLEIDAATARDAVYGMLDHPCYKAALNTQTKLQKRDALLATLDTYQRLDPGYTTLTREALPPVATFIKEYYSKNRPGWFRNAVDHWPAMQWTPRILVDKVGADTIVQIQKGRDTTKEYEINSIALKQDIRFGDFVDMVETADSNDMYLTANNLAIWQGPFKNLVNDVGNLGDGILEPSQMAQQMFLWMGPKGTVTPLHHDKSNNVFIQVYGTKRFRLIPAMQVPYMYNHLGVFTPIDLFNPDPAHHPLYQKATIIDVTVGPGEFLFIPIGWWHHVVSETASISLSFTNVPVPNYFYDYPAHG